MNRYLLFISAVLALIASGCSDIDAPDNREPELTVTEPTDVTRTSAVVAVSVEHHGWGKLDFITLHYAAIHTGSWQTVICDPAETNISVMLDNLVPGTRYSCYAEAGTATASLRSNTITFTTIPNTSPSIGPLSVLSSGPIAVIVEFDIIDDGGEAVAEAGCEVSAADGGAMFTVKLTDQKLSAGSHKLSITGLAESMSYTIVPFAANSSGRTVGEALCYTTRSSIVLESAGDLASLLCGAASLPEPLIIAGKMNGDDFRFLRGLAGAGDATISKVIDIDLTDVTICEGGGSYDGSRFTVADVLTTGLLADCSSLQRVLLPSTATALERDVLARCTALRSLTIPAGIARLLPSSGCTALSSIDVSPANECFEAVDGVLFDQGVSNILWFPIAKTGAYTLPSTVTAIAEDAFAGLSITSLVIPSSVTTIGRGAFANSALEEITLPDNLAIVATGMFQNCSALTTVRIGSAAELIGNYVFDGTSLADLYVAATVPPVVSSDSFVNESQSITATATLHVPAGSKRIYRNHSRWGQFSRIVEF